MIPQELIDEYPIKIVKCSCGSKVCQRHSINAGTFYQGCGWDKETAEWIAQMINENIEKHHIDKGGSDGSDQHQG